MHVLEHAILYPSPLLVLLKTRDECVFSLIVFGYDLKTSDV